MNQKVVDAVNVILDELNGGNRRDIADSIFSAVSHEHRTIQQLFWGAILRAQIAYAAQPSDQRNESAVELAKAVKEVAIQRNWDSGLPYV